MGKRKTVPDSDGLAGEEDKSSVDSSRSIKRQSMRTDMLLQTINEQMATIHVFSILKTSEGWNSKTVKNILFIIIILIHQNARVVDMCWTHLCLLSF